MDNNDDDDERERFQRDVDEALDDDGRLIVPNVEDFEDVDDDAVGHDPNAVAALQGALHAIEQDLEGEIRHNQLLNEDVAQLRSINSELQDKVEGLEQTIEALRDEFIAIDNSSGRLVQLIQDNTTLQHQVEVQQEALQRAENDIAQLQEDINTMGADHERFKDRHYEVVNHINRERDRNIQERDDARQQVEDMRQQMQQWQRDHDEAVGRFATAALDRIRAANDHANALMIANEELKAKNKKKKKSKKEKGPPAKKGNKNDKPGRGGGKSNMDNPAVPWQSFAV